MLLDTGCKPAIQKTCSANQPGRCQHQQQITAARDVIAGCLPATCEVWKSTTLQLRIYSTNRMSTKENSSDRQHVHRRQGEHARPSESESKRRRRVMAERRAHTDDYDFIPWFNFNFQCYALHKAFQSIIA